MGNQLERFGADRFTVNACHVPKGFLPLPFAVDVAEVMLLIPVTCFVEMIVGKDRLTIALVTIGQEDVVEAFLESFVKGTLVHQLVENRVQSGQALFPDNLPFPCGGQTTGQ